ncbi:high-affinity nicotinic acid transporter [Stagonosporopsis vannaccii]|nr:high-affinity nicotinic acid transporter [Stagonosporopsis vannaccii]
MSDEKTTGKVGVSATPDLSTGEVENQGFDPVATKKLLRKLDWHIIPFMSLIYLLCFLDRTNIGNARLDHLEQDLKLHGLQYNDCLAVLFPFYIAAEIPSNIMMKLTRPSIWLSFIMFFWSAAMIAQGFVSNYSGLMATRVFLGVFEGGLFPGVNYYISQWYQRHECGFRMALFFSAATLAGAFGGILARGIAEMSGVGGKSAWSWIFILEGLLSILVSMIAYWCIYDYPATATFLSTKERDEVERRLQEDHGHLSNDFDMKYVWQAIGDWKIYIFMFICMAGFCPIYSFALFLPTIIKNMGYSANDAQLMSVPPYVCACFFTIAASWYADRVRKRGVFMLGFQVIAIAGFSMLAATAKPNVQYAGTVLAAIGIYPQIPLGMAWNSANIGGSLKRGTGIAMQVMGGNCGGIIASYVYISRDGPRYIKGHCLLIAIIAVAFCLTFFMSTWCRIENARRAKIVQEGGARELTEEQKLLERELADNVPWFRYTT